MMQEGLGSVIEYTWDGVAMFAQFRNTDVSHVPVPVTNDPPWYVWHRDDAGSGDYEWLNYVTLDGTLWSAKLHCRYDVYENVGPMIETWFEHKPYPDGDDHNDTIINFLDWDRNPWEARLNAVYPPFPAQPTFMLRRL